MNQAPELELKDLLLSNSSFGPNEISFIAERISNDFSQFPTLKEVAMQLEGQPDRTPATNVRLGICQFMLGRYRESIDILGNADGGALAYFYQGRAYFALNEFEKAIGCYESAKTAGYEGERCLLAIAECKRHASDLEGGMAILDNMFGPIEQTAEYLYQRAATIAAVGK